MEENGKMITRRKLLAVGASAGAAAVVTSTLSRAVRADQARGNGALSGNVADYIAIKASSDPEFASALDKSFPGLRNDATFQQIQSHAVLVTNVSGRKINAFATHWKVATATGGYETVMRHYFHPRSNDATSPKKNHFGKKGNKTRFTGRIPALKTGSTRLVTPYFNWSPHHYKTHPKPKWKKILTASESRKFCFYELSRSTGVQVSVDAVIVGNKSLIGPNISKLGRRYQATRNAEHDAAVATLKTLAAGASTEQVKQLLKGLRNGTISASTNASQSSAVTPPAASSNPIRRLYHQVVRRQAHVLIRRLQNATPDQFKHTLIYLKKKPKTHIVSVAS